MNATTTTATQSPTVAHPNRILAVVKLHFVNPVTVLWTPLGIYGLIFALNWLIWLIVSISASDGGAGMSEGTTWSGASMFIFVWLLVVAVQAMNRTFHFALGFGATRRDYYLGTLLALVASAAGWAILFGVLAMVEEATNGWGLGGNMFAAVYFGDDGPLARIWYIFLIMLFFTGIGLVSGSLFVRWRTFGLIGFFAVVALLLVGAFAWIGLTDSWQQVGSFFATLGFAGSYPLLLIPFAVSVALGYLMLRRSIARS